MGSNKKVNWGLEVLRVLGVIGKVRVEEDFAFLEDKKYHLERQQVGEYILTIAEMNQ